MKFSITIKDYSKKIRLNVEQFDVTDRSEKYRVVARNKTFVMECNRPLFRNKGLKHRKPDWKVIEGEVGRGSGLEQIQIKILEVIDKGEKHR